MARRDDSDWFWLAVLVGAAFFLRPRRADGASSLPPAPAPAPLPPAPAPALPPDKPMRPGVFYAMPFSPHSRPGRPRVTPNGHWGAERVRAEGTRQHLGLDLISEPGSVVKAPFPGKVYDNASKCAQGFRIFADDGRSVAVLCVYDKAGKPARAKILVRSPQRVTAGQAVALVGNQGFFHYAIIRDGEHINPDSVTQWG